MNSFYGGLNVAALDTEYLASFYMPVFVIEQQPDGKEVLTIKNYHKTLTSSLHNNASVVNIETEGL